MLSLSKSQVKSLLDVMSSDESRPGLCQAWYDTIKDQTYLIATDSYIAVMFAVSEKHSGSVKRADLVRWYKLAERKDRFTEEVAKEMATEVTDKHPTTEAFNNILPDKSGPTEKIAFQAGYAVTLEKIAGQPLSYDLSTATGPMVALDAGNKYILMPLRS